MSPASPCPRQQPQPVGEGQSRGWQQHPGHRTWPLPSRAGNRHPKSPGTVWRPVGDPCGQWSPHTASGCPTCLAHRRGRRLPRSTLPRVLHVLGKAMDAAGEVLGHCPALHGLDTDLLQRLSKAGDGTADTAPAELALPCRGHHRDWGGWCQGWLLAVSPNTPAHLMRSGLPSSLPRCSRPRVQAKMLAMGLVLVGRPCMERALSHPAWAPRCRQPPTGTAHPPSGAPGSGG